MIDCKVDPADYLVQLHCVNFSNRTEILILFSKLSVTFLYFIDQILQLKLAQFGDI
jgi:hypothetical protein